MLASPPGIYAACCKRARNWRRSLLRTICDHLRLRFPHDERALDYNILQKLSYIAVIFILVQITAKYVMRLEVVENLHDLGGRKGGFWKDRGYEWYAGI